VSALHWPDGLDESGFRSRYWQKKPLLIRQALPRFTAPISPDELAGLAIEPDTTPRLIRHSATDGYTLEHGPFDEAIFETLGTTDWSLLVTDVDKHLPDLQAWIDPFRLAPDWRLDDLMISYAPDGASVGAHVDAYDVFLLQASGTRRWSIDARPDVEHAQAADGDLRLVEDFSPTDSWDLEPGDVLYLPPGIAHHGVAVGEDCTTWSIGFRAPRHADVVLFIAEAIAARMDDTRLTDAGIGRGSPGEIDAASVAAIARIWREAAMLDPDALTILAGSLLTRHALADEIMPEGDADGQIVRAPFARLGWAHLPDGGDEHVLLFADGQHHACSAALARALCDGGAPPAPTSLDPTDAALIQTLLDAGSLIRRATEVP